MSAFAPSVFEVVELGAGDGLATACEADEAIEYELDACSCAFAGFAADDAADDDSDDVHADAPGPDEPAAAPRAPPRVEERGAGTLAVTTRRVLWAPRGDGGGGARVGFAVHVRSIGMHAVTRDPATYPRPCLFCQVLEDDEDDAGGLGGLGGGGGGGAAADEPSEVYFAPADEASLDAMFRAFSAAAMANPDPPEDGDEDGPGDAYVGGADDGGIVALDADAAAMLRAMTGGGGGAMDMAGVDDAPAVALEYDAEHAAMLERLDGLLTVAPGLERGAEAEEGAEGQFDDADDDGAPLGSGNGANGHAPP